MREWMLRPYPHDKLRTDEFLQRRIVAIGWPFIGDARGQEEADLRKQLEHQYPQWNPKKVTDGIRCIQDFTSEMEPGDLVLIVPKKSDNKGYVLFAEVTGEYEYDATLASNSEGYPHQRAVRWIRPMIARTNLPDSLSTSLGQRGSTLTELPEGVLSAHAREQRWLE